MTHALVLLAVLFLGVFLGVFVTMRSIYWQEGEPE